ncbi:MAG: magnesium transporter CorA family protein [Lactobacillus sp.]|jgi:Mg2+ and Co2+ transporter CorA|nr:magnesium transporter CorA family protein [Lactobacillus sp.]
MEVKNWQWHHTTLATPDSEARAKEAYHLTSEQLGYAYDKNERAHVEYDNLTKSFLLVFNCPPAPNQRLDHNPRPITFIIKDKMILTFGTEVAKKELSDCLIQTEPQSVYDFLLEALFMLTGKYVPVAEALDSERRQASGKLHHKTTRKELIALSDLEANALYISTAARQNTIALKQIKGLITFHDFSEPEKERLEDVLIEATQVVEMLLLTEQNLNQLDGSYNNVLNNNLNDTMKFLTIWSILLTAPTIISGFFGQNVNLPLQHSPYGWQLSLIFVAILWFALAMIIKKFIK